MIVDYDQKLQEMDHDKSTYVDLKHPKEVMKGEEPLILSNGFQFIQGIDRKRYECIKHIEYG